MKAKNILALDLATVTGFAWGKPGTKPTFGAQRFGKAGATRAEIYKRYRLWLDLFCSAHGIEWIVYESPQTTIAVAGKTNIATVRLLIGLCEHLEEWALTKDIELREGNVAAVRNHFIGSNPKRDIAKRLTMERCAELGWAVETNDEADACALWHYQCCIHVPELGVKSTPLFRDA